MKKILFIIGLCAVLLSMPTILAFPTTNNRSLLFSPSEMSDGTFVGGFGRGHWVNGHFNVDTVSAYMDGEFTSSGQTIRISGDLTNSNHVEIGKISALMVSKILFGHTTNLQGRSTLVIAILTNNQNNQFVGRIVVSAFRSAPNIWGYLIPNT